METVERVFKSVKKENKKTEKLIKKPNPFEFNHNEEHNNRLMDMINYCKDIINDVNDVYIRLVEILHEIYEVEYENLDSKEQSFYKKLINGLNDFNTLVSRFFSELSREQALREGCREDLLDLRINIRSMRETISDIEYKLLDSEDDTNQLIDDLLAQF